MEVRSCKRLLTSLPNLQLRKIGSTRFVSSVNQLLTDTDDHAAPKATSALLEDHVPASGTR